MEQLTTLQVAELDGINTRTQAMRFGKKIRDIIAYINGDTPPIPPNTQNATEGTPVNAVNAFKVLNLIGVVKHGERVIIHNPLVESADVYEFLADEAQKKTLISNIAVDISDYTTKSFCQLTITDQPTSGDKMTIGGKVYTFVPVGTATADGEISIGADLAGAQANIVAAINGSDGVNEANAFVSAGAFDANASVITALVGGTVGNMIELSETFTVETNTFGCPALHEGADCIAANAILALVAAVTAFDTQGVGAVDGDGDTVVFTADVAGVVGNDIEIGEDLDKGAFEGGATKLSGGINGTPGIKFQKMMDSLYEYRCIADNTISGKNWRRVSLGEAY